MIPLYGTIILALSAVLVAETVFIVHPARQRWIAAEIEAAREDGIGAGFVAGFKAGRERDGVVKALPDGAGDWTITADAVMVTAFYVAPGAGVPVECVAGVLVEGGGR